MDARASLIASRPAATAYADSLAQLPASLVGVGARLAELRIHPVKGLGCLRVPAARVGSHGLVDAATGLTDRGVMLAYRRPGVTSDGQAFDAVSLSNRNEGAFATTRASLERDMLVFTARTLPALSLAPASLAPREGELVRVKLAHTGGPVLEGVLDDGPLAAWVRDLLRSCDPGGRRFSPDDVIAVRAKAEHARPVAEPHRAGEDAHTLFGDGGHALVASSSTLAWMNAALAREGQRTISMDAFRPNLILDGLPPNAEDIIGEARIVGSDGRASRLVFASMSIRCDATRVDPATGARPDAQPLAWLARNRPPRGSETNAATFAINAVFPPASQGSILRVGDILQVAGERAS